MPRPTTPSFYERFLGMSDEPATEIADFGASSLENLYIQNNQQQLERRKGTAIVVSGLTPDSSMDMLHWERLCDENRLIAVNGGNVLNLFDEALPSYNIPGGPSRFTSGIAANAALLNGKLYVGNGTDQNVRFDCSSVRQVMPGQPSAPVVVASGVCDCFDGVYKYRITYVSYDGIDSQPSDEYEFTATTGMANAVTGISTAGAAEDITGRRIWRTAANGSTYYLVTTLADNTTTEYLDAIDDEFIVTGAVLDELTRRFPPCQVLVNHQERLAGVRCAVSGEGNMRTLYLSNYGEPEVCPEVAPLDEVDNPVHGARIPLQDEAVGLATWGNVLLIFLRGSAYRLIGDNPNNWSLDKWIDVGCSAHRSIVTYQNMCFWLGPDGVYIAEGGGGGINYRRISDELRHTFEALSASDMAASHAFIWDQRYYLCLPGQAFYYDLRWKVWGELTEWDWIDSTVSKNTGSAKELIYAAKTGSGEAWQLETGTTDNGEAITATWTSKEKDMGQFLREKRVHRVGVMFTAATGDATVTLYRDGESVQTFTHDLEDVTRDGAEFSLLEDRCVEGARGEFFKLRVQSSTSHATFRILRAGLHYSLAT
jgi:hypothetical protein